MQFGTGDRPLDGSSLHYSVCKVHSWEEECSSRPASVAQTRFFPRSGHFFPGCSMQFARFSIALLYTCSLLGQMQSCLITVSPVSDPMAWKQDTFQHPWDNIHSYAFPPFALLHQVLSRARLSRLLSLLLIAPLWPQKE